MVKNVAFISFDDLFNVVRFRDVYGESLQTPNLDRLLARGTYFDNAHAVVPVCNPSRTSTLTGQSPFHTGIDNNQQAFYDVVDPATTLPFLFKQADYTTAAVGKIFHGMVTEAGLNTEFEAYVRGLFDQLQVSEGIIQHRGWGPAQLPDHEFADHNAATWAADFVAADQGQPWFLALGLRKPHLSWYVPERYFDLYDRSRIVLPDNPSGDFDDLPPFFRQFIDTDSHQNVLDAGTWRDLIVAYMAAVSFADAQLGIFLDAMDRAGAWQDTTLVVWSDHGHHLGDKQQWGKLTHWEQATNAPLIIVDPDVGTPGTVVRKPVSLMDIFPTLVELTGIDDPLARDGHSLVPLLRDPDADWDHFAGSFFQGSMSLRTERFRYIASLDGSEQLYDMVDDPGQLTNLAGDPRYGGTLDGLHDRLAAEVVALGGRIDLDGPRIIGTLSGETILVSPNLETAAGGAGDDTYLAIAPGAIVERPGGGFDTLQLFAPAEGVPVDATVPRGIERTLLADNAAGRVRGRDRDDIVIGGASADDLIGGDGADRLTGGPGGDRLDGGAGRDRLFGETHADALHGGSDNDLLAGGGSPDRLRGGTGDDRLDGGGKDDDLAGGPGEDRLLGKRGADRLNGCQGDDRLAGGGGGDRFVFEARSGTDEIVDFDPGRDRIDLTALGLDGFRDLVRDTTPEGWALARVPEAGVSIVFRHLDWSDLDPSDFLF
jgi:arylsulfatase A-like enzyme